MIYVTQGYKLKEFENKEKALEYIKQDLDKHKLNYKLIYKSSDEDLEVLIFQYNTLYMEVYVIRNEINLINKRRKIL